MRAKQWSIVLASLILTVEAVSAASTRNVYFSNGELVPGQRYRSEGQLPGPVTTFTQGQDRVARLFVIFGDLDAHPLRGQLKSSTGTVVRTLNRQANAVNTPVQWRVVTHAFPLEALAPGDYALELTIDDKAVGTYPFTLR